MAGRKSTISPRAIAFGKPTPPATQSSNSPEVDMAGPSADGPPSSPTRR